MRSSGVCGPSGCASMHENEERPERPSNGGAGPVRSDSGLQAEGDFRPGERRADDSANSVNEDLDGLAFTGPDLGSIPDEALNPEAVPSRPYIGHANRLRETGKGNVAHRARSTRKHGPADDAAPGR